MGSSPDGSGQTRLTNTPEWEIFPTWSPDGRWLAFHSDRDGSFDIWAIPAAGGPAIQLTSGPANDQKSLGLVESGQTVDILKSSDEWSLIRTPSGIEGYVLSRYLTNQPPAKSRFDQVQEKNKTLTAQAAGLVWDYKPDLTLALHLTHSERHPQAAELYSDGPHLAVRRYEIGDDRLGTETANTVDFGLRRSGDVTWRASIFYSDFKDYIFPLDSGAEEDGLPVYLYRQADATFYGAEGEIEVPVWHGADRGVNAHFGADYVRGKLDGGGNLPQMPPLRLTASLEYDAGPLHSVLGLAWYDEQDKLADNELPTDSYTLLDFEVTYRWERWKPGVLLFVKGSNLLDEEARRHSSPLKDYVPLPGRSFLLGIRLARSPAH